ncbi:1,3-beta-glucanosyltransferase gel4; AltName: Full=Glucan elongating glucanosyltransferase 4; Flags: Precursor [Serendipita indica DSM 11827]|uniref:1,3-beta-glucanosyltransferase n=1 Tax=Serendipita indica (strain DSM 11827) TaxID=1109443 RepID=G4TH45_SERID|nr:1,3-beta-glucanosyltransferase gel4; AltName: Full=Glucan elongating glucanosyltransferase 4; Flags: Precursor [Serendipita indica DSM 11827]CCA70649.1 related to GAS1-glycophospholipid-anchored surface glycoprotein [Serendipita indica DSM 11827]
MKGLLTTLLSAALAIPFVHALPRVTRTGKYLYDESGKRFFIKGIAYQEPGELPTQTAEGEFPEPTTFIDPLSQPDACDRDIPYLRQLGVNAVRVYSVDAAANHDHCMSVLSSAGIYTLIDLSLPVNGSITREDPTWTSNLLTLYLNTIEAFSKYDNVLGYNIGNEIVKDTASTITAPFIKAAARDVKAYIKSKSYRGLVGYSSTDGTGWRDPLAHFLTCESDDTSIDLWGLNDYRWCGTSTVSDSWQEAITAFSDLPVPAYFSEYGCNRDTRTWSEVPALYGTEMSAVFSGGVAFSYFPTNDAKSYGMVTVSGNTVTTSDEFTALATQLTGVTTIETPSQSSVTTPSLPDCPSVSADWLGSSQLPPTPNQAECDCIWRDSPCVFSPQTTNHAALFEELFQSACTYLGTSGGSCTPIGQNGTTGTYGQISSCDGATKLTWIFSQYYLATNNNAQSCSFAGNATVNSASPTSSSEVNAAVSSCFAATPSVYTPLTPSTTLSPVGANTGTSQPSGGGSTGGAVSIFADSRALLGVFIAMLCMLGSGAMLL